MSLAQESLPSKEQEPNSRHQRRDGAASTIIPDVRPEVVAGGIVRDDGEISYVRVNALLLTPR